MSIDWFLNFVRDHYRLIIDVVALLVCIVISCIRKRPVKAVMSAIYQSAIVGIIAAEKTGLKGSDKLDYAISIVREELLKQFPKLDVNRYVSTITYVIESILTCPEKK